MPTATPTRYCSNCGSPDTKVKFPTAQALHCEACTDAAEAHRKEYQRRYNSARSAALKRLVTKHPKSFYAFLEEEKQVRGLADLVKG